MTNEPEVNAIPEVCPFLGLADDPESHATYATDVHRCYKMERPTRIAAPHQETFCISDTYERCPVYRGDGIPQGTRPQAAASRPARNAPTTPPAPVAVPAAEPERPAARTQRPTAAPGGGRRDAFASGPQRSLNARRSPVGGGGRGGISMPVATIALFVLAIAVVAVAVFVLNQGDDDSPPLNDVAATRTAEAQGGTGETPDGEETATADPDGEETPTGETTPGDGTPADGETPTPGGDETPTEPGDGTTYTVVGGDSCSAIATANGVTLDALIAANPSLDPSTNPDCALSVGQELTIP